jgi:hypothetical protein
VLPVASAGNEDERFEEVKAQASAACRAMTRKVVHLDLASKTAIGLTLEGGIEHAVFHIVHRRNLVEPRFVDVTVARGTGASAPALGNNSIDIIVDGAFHYGIAIFDLHFLAGAVRRDVRDRGHRGQSFVFEAANYRGVDLLRSTPLSIPVLLWFRASAEMRSDPVSLLPSSLDLLAFLVRGFLCEANLFVTLDVGIDNGYPLLRNLS